MSYLLHDVFIKTVESHSDKIAIISEADKPITYVELNLLANKFANSILQIKQQKTSPFVGILSNVTVNSIAAILGALKIGCAYVPLDIQSPVDRLGKIIENCKLDIIVMDANLYDKYKSLLDTPFIKKFILLSFDNDITHNKKISYGELLAQSGNEPPSINQVSDDLAYILHTSGSTGTPKGIMVSHRNARTFVDWMHKEFQINDSDRIMSRAPLKFDLSIFDIFNTFKSGATLICYNWDNKRDHESYTDLMVNEKATILYTTPSTYIALMNHGKLDEKKERVALRTMMYAGEPFPIPQLKKLNEMLPNTKVANIYGPTETNIITYYWIKNIEGFDSIPLGKEVDDTEIIVVGEEGCHICKPYEIGEIWCRGGTVALGYLGMEDLTEQCKVTSPFHSYPAIFWRTGDFGYRDDNGLLHYKGRKDHLVKIKGYRIEIGEIEAALSLHQYLDEYAVVKRSDEQLNNQLYCYYSTLSYEITGDELMEFLLTTIPKYMVPYKFIRLSSLPKTASEKIDRVSLTERANHE